LHPDHLGLDQRNFLDHESLAKERRKSNSQAKGFRFQKISRYVLILLRNGDAAELEAAPRCDADAANVQSGVEPVAKFLLNPCLCGLRLHIQVHREQQNDHRSQNAAQREQENAREFFHRETLRRGGLKQRSNRPCPIRSSS
jgi:hypothetical protein